MMDCDREGRGTFYITTPIYYANDRPHIGHAYCTIACDALARYHRLRGDAVLFSTGVDEHGEKNARAAAARGISPQQHVDEMADQYRLMWERMGISYDRFIRTTEPVHARAVQTVFERLAANGDIYLGQYQGWYCVPCETHLTETEVVEGCCPDCGRSVEYMPQKAYFFRTSRYAERVLAHIRSHPRFIQPEYRRNEVISFIEGGVQDACITRKWDGWGIPAPGDPEQSVYVWFDALINYLTVAGYPDNAETMARWWPPQAQFVGKDILPRFHATLWPAMLLALGLELPQTVFGHGWWISDSGEKYSKSKGGVPDPYQEALTIAELTGCEAAVAVDALRYFLLREVSFGLDSSYSIMAVLSRFNADLANDLGNLLNRTLPLVERCLGSRIPEPGPEAGGLSEDIATAREGVEAALEALDLRGALEAIWALIAAGNKFMDTREPWRLHREGKRQALEGTLYDLLDCLRVVALMVGPVMPTVSARIRQQLGLLCAGQESSPEPTWEDCAAGRLRGGTEVARGAPLFPRVDLAKVQRALAAGQEREPAPEKQPPMPTITFDEFKRLELRTGRVLECEPVPKASKLLRLLVDIGEAQPRSVVAGLAPSFGPEDLLGKTVVLVANLAPATIRGVESNGMVLAVGEGEPLAIVTVDRECGPGEMVR